ncbi:signal peptide protein [Cupriavidus sp. SK-3]|uniref:copper-binding protein n=1 Tax=Cupriavidus sp. SK-3 TaxID=1470558 RepID=UPI00044F36DA|nr:copper-binding protein [Cupriavidus sp. SK-3]KDP88616.1 signal peptide protein [Cupriavidus sp. SK-3]
MKHIRTLALTLALAATPVAFAAGSMDGMDMKSMDMKGMDMKPSAASQQAPVPVAAEIKKIDAKAGKVTLKHGPIENLGMSAMTMAFPVKDRASLKNFKAGESVSVMFDKVDGKPTVVDMQRK